MGLAITIPLELQRLRPIGKGWELGEPKPYLSCASQFLSMKNDCIINFISGLLMGFVSDSEKSWEFGL